MLANVVVQSASSWPLFFSALIGVVAAVVGGAVGYYVQHRGAMTLASEERSWQRKSEVYVDLIGLMHRIGIELGIYDAGFLVPGGPVSDDELPQLLAARLRTFGSTKVRELLSLFWRAREDYLAAADEEAKQIAKDRFEQSISEVEAQVRRELNA
ncbi:MAG TPA: hypothetical protein VHU85_06210 [Acidimicrobiales bacterium]|jgi:hypothetical protein|nr:hypothetical protein [Acidimicrobiales bacterium]